MSFQKLMTNSQGLYFAKMGRDKGVTAEQAQLAATNGLFALALEAAKNGKQLDYLRTVLIPPPGGCIHLLRAKVILDRDWQEAINTGGPQTPADCNVRKVGNLYLPTGKGEVEREYILLNNAGAGFDAALIRARENRLNLTAPQEVFAISEDNPVLHSQLGFNSMRLVATTDCEFEDNRLACYAWWDRTWRGADLDWVGHFTAGYDWFAFSRDLPL